MTVDLKDKRKQEVELLKEGRKEEVVLAAIEVFKQKGIDNTKMTDVAKEAQIGIASVYRYFKTKLDLTIAVAMMVWQQEINALYLRYEEASQKAETGWLGVKHILSVFIELYDEHPDFLKFVHEFDVYLVREQADKEKLECYEKCIVDLKSMLIQALNRGISDGSIRADLDTESYYYTATHALMSLAQKLLLRGHILISDANISDHQQLEMLIDMSLHYLK